MRPFRPPSAHARRAGALVLAVLALGAVPRASLAQLRAGTAALPMPGSEVERASRLRQLLGFESAEGMLARTAGTQLQALAAGRDTVVLLAPEFLLSYHSAHPWGANDGPLRAGRGLNVLASAGVAMRFRRVSVLLAPQVAREANLAFQTIPYPQTSPPERKVWANPFYRPGNTMDLPQRFGDEARTHVSVQGRIAVDVARGVRVGVGNEQRWWGPGLQNALLISAHAPAFAQVFVESPRPIETAIGAFDYQYVLGRLDESEHFDSNPRNDTRSLSAAVVTWRAPKAWGLWPDVGIARGVMAGESPGLATALDAFRDVGRPWSRPADTVSGREQIATVFARWLVPAEGVEAWAEWARMEQPASLRELLEQPGHSQGYTLGFQWARPWRAGTLHLATEFTYLEPSPSIRVRPVRTSYTGTSVAQGWTHRGEMLGPWIGPAASSQWVAADYRTEGWRAGLTLGRLRRDANYRLIEPEPFKREDLQLYAAFRAGRRLGQLDALVEFSNGVRLNHLYQAYDLGGPSGNETAGVDLLNRSLTVILTPRLPRVIR